MMPLTLSKTATRRYVLGRRVARKPGVA